MWWQAEIEVMLPQTKEHHKVTEAERGKDWFPLRAFKKSTTLLTLVLDFWPPELRENKFLILSQPMFWKFVKAAVENEHNDIKETIQRFGDMDLRLNL